MKGRWRVPSQLIRVRFFNDSACTGSLSLELVALLKVAGTALGAGLLLVAWSAALGQKKEQAQVRLPDEQAINLAVSEMLAAWQIGDVQLLHKYYAENVTVVSGAYEPPLMGWASYLKAYQRQRERLESVRLDRQNTYLNVKANIAWAAYQWEFAAVVDGKPTTARGHTTLILEKGKDRWLIVYDHTSLVPEVQAAPPGPQKPGA